MCAVTGVIPLALGIRVDGTGLMRALKGWEIPPSHLGLRGDRRIVRPIS